jgi:biotin carboxyl carrier protein
VLVRRAFEVAVAAHSNHTRLHYRYAWPSGSWGSLPIEGGLEAVYRAELERAEDPEKLRIEIEERLNTFNSPFRVAEAFLVEEIIDPRDTRPLLCEFANLAAPLRQSGLVSAGMRPWGDSKMIEVKVRATIGGSIWQIVAAAGDEVAKDDPILIMESMKWRFRSRRRGQSG